MVLASEKNDLDAISLIELGNICYTKDFLSMSVLRGEADLEDAEFKIERSQKRRKSS